MIRIVPETYNRDDWPRLIAQAINRLIVRQEECCASGSALEMDGGDASGNDASIEIDAGGA